MTHLSSRVSLFETKILFLNRVIDKGVFRFTVHEYIILKKALAKGQFEQDVHPQ